MADAVNRCMRAFLLATAVLFGCQAADAVEPPAKKATPPEQRFEQDMLVRFHMHENFDLLRTIEKRVIHGKLDEARALARGLADAPDEPGLGPWAHHQIAVRERAAALARAKTVAEASIAEARLAVACAGCHVDAGVSPEFRTASSAPADGNTIAARMARHVWATDRLWQGIVGGDDESWSAGLDVLAQTPLKQSTWSANRVELARRLQQLADQARTRTRTDAPADRARIYGELLTTCSACHAAQ